MKNVRWDDLQIFAAVARGGGLSAASQELGPSPATIGRRMLALEQEIGRPLFVRSQSGYALTAHGRTLLDRTRTMEAGARRIDEWLESAGQRAVVRLSAGTWTANFLADNFGRLWRPEDGFRIAFRTTEARLDIAHREIELGIRNRPAESGNLASRRLTAVAFAPFRARSFPLPGREPWLAVTPEDAIAPSQRWLAARPELEIAAWANSPRTLLDLIRAGIGKGVLPCFAGDRDPQLERAGPLIEELDETQWLVMHDDDRHRPEVRTVIERIAALVAEHAPLYAGSRPLGAA
jgi:DNA-binding transcriptional LysR family regulator